MVRRRRIEGDKEVDLAALVDVLSNMLFFLLATVTFLQLKTLNAAVPTLSSGPVSTGKGVDVSLEIHATGYVLKATGEPADPKQTFAPVDKAIARKSDGHLDTDELRRQLWEIKRVAPEQKNIMIFPEEGILFDEIVQTMDASRERPGQLDPKKRVQLFPRPVLSELITKDPAMPDGSGATTSRGTP